ncbi:MAG TPA: dienelactone hydrolase family protein [Hyphomicrobiaceae bacterium]|nr:dienelactone hydrolase family protein [Hyphomicrobiaceae bacterium]
MSTRARCWILPLLLLAPLAPPAAAQGAPEAMSLSREHRGKRVTIKAELFLPPGAAKVPAMVIVHGSGGVSAEREGRYAREMVQLGVAALIIDSFRGRGIASTVQDQAQVSSAEMTEDAFAGLKSLAGHPRIEATRVGLIGFSKGGTVALLAAHEARAARALPPDLRFALHVPVYPWCGSLYFKPKSTGAPIYMLLGGADTYVGVAPCQENAASLKAEGAHVEVTVFPGAAHGFDAGKAYHNPRGENQSRCVFVQQPDGSWKERTSGFTTNDATGRRIDPAYGKALAACRTYGVSGGPNAEAKAKAMAALKGYVQRHLIEGK